MRVSGPWSTFEFVEFSTTQCVWKHHLLTLRQDGLIVPNCPSLLTPSKERPLLLSSVLCLVISWKHRASWTCQGDPRVSCERALQLGVVGHWCTAPIASRPLSISFLSTGRNNYPDIMKWVVLKFHFRWHQSLMQLVSLNTFCLNKPCSWKWFQNSLFPVAVPLLLFLKMFS